jgi:hypothetical protein
MTIDNLYAKCLEKKIEVYYAKSDWDKDHDEVKNYDDTTKSGRKAID